MLTTLDEDQKKAMMKELAYAFEFASVNSATPALAAVQIAGWLQNAGYRIILDSKGQQ